MMRIFLQLLILFLDKTISRTSVRYWWIETRTRPHEKHCSSTKRTTTATTGASYIKGAGTQVHPLLFKYLYIKFVLQLHNNMEAAHENVNNQLSLFTFSIS